MSRGAAPLFLAGAGRQSFDPSVSESFPEQQRGPILAALFGVGMEQVRMEGLRGVGLDRSDPLAEAEFFVLVGARGSYALVARPDGEDRVLGYLTQEPEAVHFIARYLLRRIPPPGGDGMALPPPIRGVESGEFSGRAWTGYRPFPGS